MKHNETKEERGKMQEDWGKKTNKKKQSKNEDQKDKQKTNIITRTE